MSARPLDPSLPFTLHADERWSASAAAPAAGATSHEFILISATSFQELPDASTTPPPRDALVDQSGFLLGGLRLP